MIECLQKDLDKLINHLSIIYPNLKKVNVIMASCVFFGHRNFCYTEYTDKLKDTITYLIENKGVTQFYTGLRGNFDKLCADAMRQIKKIYPHVRFSLALAYIPCSEDEKETYNNLIAKTFDDSIFLLEHNVPPKYAILETNKRLVDMVDYVVAGVYRCYGGAYKACLYALQKKKTVINVANDVFHF